ncbi:hypothetical protein PC121_g9279 [Phytophthora cactorum]|nr:hypothetical protein PC120_g7024 [Phytophthora cactorum]KAG3071323.1 hypothetical protein PC121_g9279 [Phytophthora cactorum]
METEKLLTETDTILRQLDEAVSSNSDEPRATNTNQLVKNTRIGEEEEEEPVAKEHKSGDERLSTVGGRYQSVGE